MCFENNLPKTYTMQTIPEYYEGKNIFLSGASGFLGKSIVEKLLRSCPNIGTIYILLRPKRGKELNERLSHLIEDRVFDRLKQEKPNLILKNKIVALQGNMTELNLGLSETDRKTIINNIEIIFNVAATIRFDEPLKTAVILNMRGTREMCQIALETKKLESFIHVSTAYVNCKPDSGVIEEVLYEAKGDWRKTIEIAENCDENFLNILQEKYINSMPNTYCFTKSLAEHIVKDMCSGKIPSKIIRPSIVTAAIEDPVPGWVDNMYGPASVLIAIGKGILRTLPNEANAIPDNIPIDICAKSIIVAAWDLALRRNITNPEVIHCTCNKIEFLSKTLSYFMHTLVEVMKKLPMNDPIWLPNIYFTRNKIIVFIYKFLFMLLPAMILDIVYSFTGKKIRIMKFQKKMETAMNSLDFFLNSTFTFSNKKLFQLNDRILSDDYKDWNYDFSNNDTKEYLTNYVHGLRILINELDNTIPKARKQLKLFSFMDKLVHFIFYSILILLLYKYFFSTYF